MYFGGFRREARLERGFTGHEHIRQFNLINMNARLYDPRIGKFFSPDNVISSPENPQDYNRYSYAHNNPLIYTDP
ncbi:MAG: RHS repeat domain-containing protein, partial [Chloroflexota bacterium]